MDNTSLPVDTYEASTYLTRAVMDGYQAEDGSIVPQHGLSSVSDYLVRFLEWVRCTPTFFPIEQDLRQRFLRD